MFRLLTLVGLFACTLASAQPVAEIAPTGKLRAAINYGNAVLASKDANGQPQGVSVDLARALDARDRHRVHRAVRDNRRRLSRSCKFSYQVERGSRSRRYARGRRRRQRVR